MTTTEWFLMGVSVGSLMYGLYMSSKFMKCMTFITALLDDPELYMRNYNRFQEKYRGGMSKMHVTKKEVESL